MSPETITENEELRDMDAVVRPSEASMKPKKESWGEHLKPLALPSLPNGPFVSVLVANYNYGRFLGQALESVLKQTYQKFEIIFCDDGSPMSHETFWRFTGRNMASSRSCFKTTRGNPRQFLPHSTRVAGSSFVFSTRTIPSYRPNSRNLSRLSCMRRKQDLWFTGSLQLTRRSGCCGV